MNNGPPKWACWLTGLIAVPTFLLGLNMAFVGADEPRYARVAVEMLQRRDLITPTLGGQHWFEKPVLLYWLEILGYSVFGISEASARLGPTLCGVGTVFCLWQLGRYGARDRGLANWFALTAASTLGLIAFSHGASTDIVLTFPFTAAMTAFFIFERTNAEDEDDNRHVFALAVMYVAIGFGLLAKGLVAVVLSPAIILAYYAVSRVWPPRKLLVSIVWGLPITLAVAATWYLPMYLRHGDEFVQEFIVRQHFARFATDVYQHSQPFYFYLYVLAMLTLPWLPFAAVGTWRAIRAVSVDSSAVVNDRRRLLAYALCWLMVPLVFFSLSSAKLPGYILPAVPAAIVLSGIVVSDLIGRNRIWTKIAAGLAAISMTMACAALLFVLPKYADERSILPLLRAADANGHASTPILLMHSYNFSGEFYAADRLPVDSTGNRQRLYGAKEVENEMKARRLSNVLVIVPDEYLYQLTDDNRLVTSILAKGDEDVMAAVSLR